MLGLLLLLAVLPALAQGQGSCAERCFIFDEFALCQCDEMCSENMDCCPDFEAICTLPDCGNFTCVRGECMVDPLTLKPKCDCPRGYGDLKCSSPKCTRLGRVCTQEATCVNKKCVCPHKGWGIFECARSDQLVCAVKLDPHAKSFGQSLANVYWPCRYRLARFITKVSKGHGHAHSHAHSHDLCFIEVLAFNQISQKSGKHFVSGVEVAVSVNIPSQGAFSAQAEIVKFDLFGDGVAGNRESGVRFNSVGTGAHPTLNNVTIDCEYDPVQNFALLSIPRCQNFRLKFRPHNRHEDPGPQSLAPGVSVRVDHAQFKEPLSQYPGALCGTKTDGSTLYKVPGLRKAEKVLLDLLQQQQVDQTTTLVKNPHFDILDVVDHPDECAVAKETIMKCNTEDERRITVKTCIGLLSNRRYTRCMRDLAMVTFRYCLEALCNNVVADRCDRLATLAGNNGCLTLVPIRVRALCSL